MENRNGGKMRISRECAECIYDKQCQLTENEEYRTKVKSILDGRNDTMTSPLAIYAFSKLYESMFGKGMDYAPIKREFNDLVLSMEEELWEKIRQSEDPLLTSILYARIGNYIDFGAMTNVDPEEFLALFDEVLPSGKDLETYASFQKECEAAKTFLLAADNCGEIVLDKLLIRELKKRVPHLSVSVMVRGGEVINDVTEEDALYTGIDQDARIISTGYPVPGIEYSRMSGEARTVLDQADVILSKGQGNYESLSGTGRHVFFLFLCKCALFEKRFGVSRLSGMFIEER